MAERTKRPSKSDARSKELTCGLVMPISALDGCTAEHWLEVKSILTDTVHSLDDPRFSVRLVSDADEVGVIQKRIVQNIYSSDIVVVDVSGKNPNVMFELGLRLAFDKPAVIVIDDRTDYSFDTGVIEHLTYPRDLRFGRIVEFKENLAKKVTSTYKTLGDTTQSSFLKSFGPFRIAALKETEVPADTLILETLEEVRADIRRLQRRYEIATRSPIESLDTVNTGIIQLSKYVYQILQHEGLDPASLLGNTAFYERAAVDGAAARYFSRYSDFREALDGILRAASAQTGSAD